MSFSFQFKGATYIAPLTPPDEVARLRAEVARLRGALIDTAANMAGAASAYRKYARVYQQRGDADAFFSTRVMDMDNAVRRAQTALGVDSD